MGGGATPLCPCALTTGKPAARPNRLSPRRPLPHSPLPTPYSREGGGVRGKSVRVSGVDAASADPETGRNHRPS